MARIAQDDDLLIVNRGGVDYRATVAEVKPPVCELEELPEPPAVSYGIFHIINPSERLRLKEPREGKLTIFDLNGNDLGARYYVDPSEEIIVHVEGSVDLFATNFGASWTFGDQTDTSRVLSFYGFFSGCLAFNDDISDWDTSSCTSMRMMFYNCMSFNQDIGNWNTSKVTSMEDMFSQAGQFNQDLSQWCVSSIDLANNGNDGFAATGGPFESNTAFHPVWGTCPRGEDTP